MRILKYFYTDRSNILTITDNFIQFADHWRSTMLMSNEDVAQMVEDDEIDILITLAGRFDENRPIVASFRPAPVQVSFMIARQVGRGYGLLSYG